MTNVVEAAHRLHERQLEAATQVQDLMIKAVDGLAHLRHRAPHPPQPVARPLKRITAPAVKAIGAPSDVTAYFGQATRDWIQLERRFQDAVFGVGAQDMQQSAEPATKTTEITKITKMTKATKS